MEKIAFFDSKPYDRTWFDKLNKDFEIQYFESRLRPESVGLRTFFPMKSAILSAAAVSSRLKEGVAMSSFNSATASLVAVFIMLVCNYHKVTNFRLKRRTYRRADNN